MPYRGLPFTSGLAALGMLVSVQAAEWSFEPDVTASMRFDDNLRMNTTDELETTEFALRPSADFSRSTERSRLTGSASIHARRFNEDGLDSNDSRFGINGYYSATERTRLNLSANWLKDTTLESELDETGVVLSRSERQSTSVAPGISYILNERWSVTANINARKVKYENPVLRDYDYNTANGQLTWQYTPRTAYTMALGLSDYTTANDAFKSDNRQLTLAVSHEFTERTKMNLSAGYRKTKSETRSGTEICPTGYADFSRLEQSLPDPTQPCFNGSSFASKIPAPTLSTSSSGSVLSASLERQLERGSLSMTASRSVSPSASDGLIVSDRLSFSLNHSFTEKLQATLEFSWYQSSNTDSSATDRNNTFYTARPTLSWKLDEDWRFSASYRYRKEEREGALGSPDSNSISAAITYQWPKMSVSR